MASKSWLTPIILGLPFVTAACFQSPPSADILRKSDISSAELSHLSAISSGAEISQLEVASVKPYAKVAKKHAEAYGLDWKLVIAVMEQESSFRHNVTSRKGAYGLMQIMPHTRAEIRRKLGLNEAKTPYNNVKAGSYYLKRLARNFSQADGENRLKLTLAAYNAGLTRVRDAQRIAEYLGEDRNSWESVRSSLTLLSRRFTSLHEQVWEDGKPRGGYFNDPTETLNYVDDVIAAYQEYILTSRDVNPGREPV